MSLRLFDTARRSVVPFDPGPVVSMYVCGITPYDSTHLGHAFTYLAHDLVVRRLEDLGHEVHLVRNFTDIDDPLYAKAAELGVEADALAEEEIARFRNDMDALDARPALVEPLVSTSIHEIIVLIEVLAERGVTYTVDGITFFDARAFDRFGELSGLDEAAMIEASRERGGTPDDPRQRHPLDFVLWKPSAPGEATWESPVGPGRPGWHIECSAMAATHLGTTIDLHGGGSDLIYPHHECEIAQSVVASGQPYVRHWMHVAMVGYEGHKMSKSRGNLVFVSELRKVVDPRAIRLALLPQHYRDDFEWFDTMADDGTRRLELLLAAAEHGSGPDPAPTVAAVRAAIDDDLDTATAWAELSAFATAMVAGHDDHPDAPDGLRDMARLLGIDLDRPR